ncbi:hypothetical protein VCRA2119O147_2230006 [Vibrio crassostreae]|uniref:Uncharacterized protein n=1 Tax=Vibrio crassostreae TaxID=246167 RepID=A0ABM9QVZ3_9VIBR|nr:hypothetical protein VCRA2119O44_480009 [Vibrio crassostreae]CAK2177493.1 hypothetical protein VCRA2113O356_500005 [Vibrio crassostreae]CAK2314394.1 hypothetical protein VCRA2119O147_2230006 [Vibrio crassostreae]CAK2382451.1 hypothetical protein VCRA2117O142_640010 [Vibrio crassostreae]CAK2916723.1 hypothetical protein VCRA2117O36_440009 [Vibrio crassostreae]
MEGIALLGIQSELEIITSTHLLKLARAIVEAFNRLGETLLIHKNG